MSDILISQLGFLLEAERYAGRRAGGWPCWLSLRKIREEKGTKCGQSIEPPRTFSMVENDFFVFPERGTVEYLRHWASCFLYGSLIL
jgi:hypothetical protein